MSDAWYADTDGGGVTHVHLTSDNTEIGTYEREAGMSDLFWVVVRSRVKGAQSLITEAFDRSAAILTILSRWDLH